LWVVTGAGGFVGGHLVASLLSDEAAVRAVDFKPLDRWHQLHPAAENLQLDLRQRLDCERALAGSEHVYHLAADMGGVGYLETARVNCMLSTLIDVHVLQAAVTAGVRRLLYSSSACVYPDYRQDRPDCPPLRECDAYPAMPEDGYGWQKLYTERMCRHFSEELGLETRVVRLHNVYGPHGTWRGGREKAPAAVCRKVAEAKHSGEMTIEIWGDGSQKRSFTYIDDSIVGLRSVMAGNVREPLNVGSSEAVTIDELVDRVELIGGVELERRYDPSAPTCVSGRNSDNTLIRACLGWEPSTSLEQGLPATYEWIEQQVAAPTPVA
jgi:GDP-D-mannose 3',5'-epimerase